MMDWGNSGRHGAWMAMIWTVNRTQPFRIAEFRSAADQRPGKKKLQWAGEDAQPLRQAQEFSVIRR